MIDKSNELDEADEKAKEARARPTLRCLLEDLGPEVDDDELRDALRTAEADLAADPCYLLPLPLTEVSHAVLDKAQQIAADPAADRRKIETISDRHLIRVKTGPRRGALWEGDDGQWWLLAAGRRKDDGGGDFYRELEQHYSHDSTPIAPTQRDRDYLRLEIAYSKECRAERQVHKTVLQALLEASSEPATAVEIGVFGADVTLRVVSEEADVAVIEVTWSLQTFEDQDRFPYDLLAMIPAGDSIEDWSYLAPRPGSSMDQLWWTYVPQRWIDDLAVSAELDELIGPASEWTPPDPVSDGSDGFSHWAKGSVVTRSYIEGIEIVGLCGARVVGHRDYETLAVCPQCDAAVELVRSLREGADDA